MSHPPHGVSICNYCIFEPFNNPGTLLSRRQILMQAQTTCGYVQHFYSCSNIGLQIEFPINNMLLFQYIILGALIAIVALSFATVANQSKVRPATPQGWDGSDWLDRRRVRELTGVSSQLSDTTGTFGRVVPRHWSDTTFCIF